MKLILLCMITLLIPPLISGAMLCNYSETPDIEFFERIDWTCEINLNKNNTEPDTIDCLSYVRDGNDYFQINPEREVIEHYGIVDSFESNYGFVNVYFTKEQLRHNKTVVFGVQCQNETFEANVTPMYESYTKHFDRAVWSRQNAIYLVTGFIIIIVLAFLLGFIIRRARYA